jgi:hypothetical protein
VLHAQLSKTVLDPLDVTQSSVSAFALSLDFVAELIDPDRRFVPVSVFLFSWGFFGQD